MWKLVLLILCVPTPNACLPHQQMDIYNHDNPADENSFPSQAACLERRDWIREQANAFVLSAECYRVVSLPIVRMK